MFLQGEDADPVSAAIWAYLALHDTPYPAYHRPNLVDAASPVYQCGALVGLPSRCPVPGRLVFMFFEGWEFHAGAGQADAFAYPPFDHPARVRAQALALDLGYLVVEGF